jgi:hypothetical protein
VIHLTLQARNELTGDEALVVEASRSFRPLASDEGTRVYAHRMAVPHLARRDVTIDCRRTVGMRRFRSDLPPDFGLRAVLGRVETS